MRTVYVCNNCGFPMDSEPSYEYGRCPSCWAKLYPNGYGKAIVVDNHYVGGHPAPSWEEDKKKK